MKHIDMRVLCVDNGPVYNPFTGMLVAAPELSEGEVYTVKETLPEAYTLQEVKSRVGFNGFWSKRFVPLTGDRTEVLKEVKEEELCTSHMV